MRSLIILIVCYYTVLTAQGQQSEEKFAPNKDGQLINTAYRTLSKSDPFSRDASYTARVNEATFRVCRSCIWYTEYNISTDPNKPEFKSLRATYRDKLPDERFAAIDKAFEERKKEDEDNREWIAGFVQAEQRQALSIAGVSPKATQFIIGENRLPVDPKDFNEAVVKYKRAQWESENRLAEKVDEILNPSEQTWFMRHVHLNCIYLSHPFMAKYMDLTESQCRQIDAHVDSFRRYQVDQRETDKSSPPAFLKKEEFWIHCYRPLTVLNHKQFVVIAKDLGFMKPEESIEELAERLSPGKGPISKALSAHVQYLVRVERESKSKKE